MVVGIRLALGVGVDLRLLTIDEDLFRERFSPPVQAPIGLRSVSSGRPPSAIWLSARLTRDAGISRPFHLRCGAPACFSWR